jgi:esterase/lipase superfamily enzyme
MAGGNRCNLRSSSAAAFLTACVAGLAATLLYSCAGNKPPADQVFLMPAPIVSVDRSLDPFHNARGVIDGDQPCVLYATDRAPTKDPERFAWYSDERGQALRLGEACVQLVTDEPVNWQEARRIALLKDRSEKYPLKISSTQEYGILERTAQPFRSDVVYSPLPGQQFADAVDAQLGRTTSKDVYIYVHGYKVQFENPVLVASELWSFLGYEGVFIAYSWPATRKTLAYWSDLDDALNSARGLRMLITYLAENTGAQRIHLIGYSAGTRLVARALADLGMYGRFLDEAEIKRRAKLGNVILVGSDVDRSVLGGYILDGALRVPSALTIYISSADSALDLSKRIFLRERAGQAFGGEERSEARDEFLHQHPKLRVIDVTDAESGTSGSGHGYLRESPWVSSDVIVTLLYGLAPEERGLVRRPGRPIWTFPPDYPERLDRALARTRPGFGSAPGSRLPGAATND